MKKHVLFVMVALLSLSCSSQEKETAQKAFEKKQDTNSVQPQGTWKVDKEYDEHGNLIRYDSIYSWSSTNKYDDLTAIDRDSLLHSFRSGFFNNFSSFESQGFEDLFAPDSLFSKRFFNDDFFDSNFGRDFMDIESIRQRMLDRQKKFLEKYQSEFKKPEKDN